MAVQGVTACDSVLDSMPTCVVSQEIGPGTTLTLCDDQKYSLGKQIGKGGFSRCFVARACTSGRAPPSYAVKIIEAPRSKQRGVARGNGGGDQGSRRHQEAMLQRELSALVRARAHPHIVHFYDVTRLTTSHSAAMEAAGMTVNRYALRFELCTRTTVHHWTAKHGHLTSRDTRWVMRQVLLALHFLHTSVGVVHRDLKPQNLLLQKHRGSGSVHGLCVKLCDLGLCAKVGDQKASTAGTPRYMAPEMARMWMRAANADRTALSRPSIDVWSAGVLLFHIHTGAHPFDVTSAERSDYLRSHEDTGDNGRGLVFAKICHGVDDSIWAIAGGRLSDDARNLVAEMLCIDASHRPATTDVLQHPFLDTAARGDETLPRVTLDYVLSPPPPPPPPPSPPHATAMEVAVASTSKHNT